MLEPKELELTAGGIVKTFILTKFPAVDGREIVAKYPVSNMPKIGEYQQSEDVMLKLMSFVFVRTDGGDVALSTKALVNNHAGDWETLARLEWAMLEYNCSFFGNGRTLDFSAIIIQKVQPLISQILMALSAQSLGAAKQPSEN